MEYAQLSLEELQQQALEVEQQPADLERLLRQRLREERGDFVRELRERIEGKGYEVNEIAALLMGRSGNARSRSSMKCYVDSEDSEHVYMRGPLPQWMREKMLAKGYDPDTKKEGRDRFKAECLTLVED
jgi:DNA-binding protein H-NS